MDLLIIHPFVPLHLLALLMSLPLIGLERTRGPQRAYLAYDAWSLCHSHGMFPSRTFSHSERGWHNFKELYQIQEIPQDKSMASVTSRLERSYNKLWASSGRRDCIRLIKIQAVENLVISKLHLNGSDYPTG